MACFTYIQYADVSNWDRSKPPQYVSAIRGKVDRWRFISATRTLTGVLITTTVNIVTSITPHGPWIDGAVCPSILVTVKSPLNQ